MGSWMPAVLTYLDSTDSTALTSLSFGTVVPGTPTSSIEVHIWNQQGNPAADPARNVRLRVMARHTGDPVFLSSGLPMLDGRWAQVQVLHGVGAMAGVQPTGWISLGAGASLTLGDIPGDGGIAILVRLSPPLGASTDALDLEFQPDDLPSTPLDRGHTADPDGVFSGIGDSYYSALVVGGPVTQTGTPGGSVSVPYLGWITTGIPHALPAQTLAIDSTDSASATPGAGEAFYVLLSLTASGTLVATKGAKAALSSAIKPTLPTGNVGLAYILRDSTGIILAADITLLAQPAARYSFAASGLVVSLGPGSARVDNALVEHGAQQVSLVDASTNYVWLQRDGNLSVAQTSPPPQPGACLIWEFDTASGAVTASRDRRIFIGPALRRLELRAGSPLTVSMVSPVEVNAEVRTVYLDPERPVVVALEDSGTGTGSTSIDIQISDAGGSWTSIFASTANMPAVAAGAGDPIARACQPSNLAIPSGARVRIRIAAVTTVAPQGATAVVGALLR